MNAPLPKNASRYTLAEIAEALGVHRTSVLRRAKKESWPAEKAGRGMAYSLSTLPRAVARKVSAYKAIQAAMADKELERENRFILVIDGEAFAVRRISS
jgi:DNA-binding Lrp family transcriptional regulator